MQFPSKRTFQSWTDHKKLSFLKKAISFDIESVKKLLSDSDSFEIKLLNALNSNSTFLLEKTLYEKEKALGLSLPQSDHSIGVNSKDGERQPQDFLDIRIVLCDLRSRLNVGSITRSTEAYRLGSIWSCGITEVIDSPDIGKTAMGTSKNINFKYIENVEKAIETAKKEGCTLVGLEQAEESTTINNFKPVFPLCIFIGNEKYGLPSEIINKMDLLVEIPLYGIKNSLNVGVAFGILAHHIRNNYTPNPRIHRE